MMRFFKSSTFRFSVLYLLSFGLSLGVVLSYMYWNTSDALHRQAQEAVAEEVRFLAQVHRRSGLSGLLQTLKEREGGNKTLLYSFTNAWGLRVSGNLAGLPVQATKKTGWITFDYFLPEEERSSDATGHRALAYITELPGGLRLLIGKDIVIHQQFDRVVRYSIVWGLGLAFALGVCASVLLSRTFLRRVERMRATAHAIMAGDLSRRIPVLGSGDELDRLAQGLNDMLTQIERLMLGMREVSNHVAHELKTPLTRIRAQVENTLSGEASLEAYAHALGATITNCDALLKTFNALLSIAQAEAGQNRAGFSKVDLSALIDEISELYDPTIEDASGTLTCEVQGALFVWGNRQLLAQAITNLLDNALKYGRNGDTGDLRITLSAHEEGEKIVVSVSDCGRGLRPEAYGRVTQRFVRLEETADQPGSGLGLTLVASVARLHGEELVFCDHNPGLTVALRLPRAPDV